MSRSALEGALLCTGPLWGSGGYSIGCDSTTGSIGLSNLEGLIGPLEGSTIRVRPHFGQTISTRLPGGKAARNKSREQSFARHL